MSSAWLLPEHIADVLPSQARRIEELRRELLDMARSYGCELVIPPLLEHLDSLLSGTGSGSGIKLFKLVDQLSGRTLGLRADITPQVARIDAHLLNRSGVTRLLALAVLLPASAAMAAPAAPERRMGRTGRMHGERTLTTPAAKASSSSATSTGTPAVRSRSSASGSAR